RRPRRALPAQFFRGGPEARRRLEALLALAYRWDPVTIGRLKVRQAFDWCGRAADLGLFEDLP
ncbi:MAG: hypothetical protein V4466_12490, partial [Pseudomonadota bacterium]